MTEETEIKEKKKGGRPPAKKVEFTPEELQEKLTSTFNAIALAMRSDKRFTPVDFREEAKDLVRLAGKYPWLSQLLAVLDPLFLVLNILRKFQDLIRELRAKREKAGGSQHEPYPTAAPPR